MIWKEHTQQSNAIRKSPLSIDDGWIWSGPCQTWTASGAFSQSQTSLHSNSMNTVFPFLLVLLELCYVLHKRYTSRFCHLLILRFNNEVSRNFHLKSDSDISCWFSWRASWKIKSNREKNHPSNRWTSDVFPVCGASHMPFTIRPHFSCIHRNVLLLLDMPSIFISEPWWFSSCGLRCFFPRKRGESFQDSPYYYCSPSKCPRPSCNAHGATFILKSPY